jgi:hypothetical protein
MFAMTIREFQTKLGATATTNRLFSALHRLRSIESPQALQGEDVTSSNWVVWNDLTEPGCLTLAN